MVRKRKADLTDAEVIAKCILQGEGALAHLSSFDSTKPVLRTSSELSRLAVALNHMSKRFQAHFPKETFILEELQSLKRAVEESMVSIRNYGLKQIDDMLKNLYLRRALYIAASIAQRHDQDLKKYYLKKRGEGKRYKEATVANAKHLLYRVYAVWKRKTPYLASIHS